MEFGVIEEIGTSFLVGAIALLLFEGLLFFATGWTMTGFFRLPLGIDPPKDEIKGAVRKRPAPAPAAETAQTPPPGEIRSGVFVALAIVVGLSISAIAQRPVDEAARPLHAASGPIFSLICESGPHAVWCMDGGTSLRELRLRVLQSETSEDKLSGLGREFASHGIPSRYCTPPAGIAKSRIANNASEAKLMLEEACGLKLFYTAKNWAFMQPTLFKELASSEARVHLFGAIALVCVLLLPIASMFLGVGLFIAAGPFFGTVMLLVGGVGTAALLMFLFAPTGEIDWVASGAAAAAGAVLCGVIVGGLVALVQKHMAAGQRPQPRKVAIRVMALVSIIFVSHLVSYLAYSREQDELGRRVFGYFSSAHVVVSTLGPKSEATRQREF
jgi:hypothetical protein